MCCLLAFEYCGKHIQAFFSKRFEVRCGMLESVEPVEIFHQFIFFGLCELNDIASRKLIWIIYNRFIDISGLNAIDLGYISIKQNFLPFYLDDELFQIFNFHDSTQISSSSW
jgi:hypothetical protein